MDSLGGRSEQIGEMIKTIQSETRTAVGAMDQGVSEVEKGTGEVAKSGKALEAILNQIGKRTRFVGFRYNNGLLKQAIDICGS